MTTILSGVNLTGRIPRERNGALVVAVIGYEVYGRLTPFIC